MFLDHLRFQKSTKHFVLLCITTFSWAQSKLNWKLCHHSAHYKHISLTIPSPFSPFPSLLLLFLFWCRDFCYVRSYSSLHKLSELHALFCFAVNPYKRANFSLWIFYRLYISKNVSILQVSYKIDYLKIILKQLS